MRLILSLFLLANSISIFAEEVYVDEALNFLKSEQKFLEAPFVGGSCRYDAPLNLEIEFDSKKCIEELCPMIERRENIKTETLLLLGCSYEGGPNQDGLCQREDMKKFSPMIKEIRERLKTFIQTELDLAGKKIRASINYIKNPENLNSPFDNLGSNIGDLCVFVLENGDLFEIKESDTGFNFEMKNKSKIESRMKKVFNLSKSEAKASLETIKAIFADSNSIVAIKFLGPDYVIKKIMDERGLDQDPDEVLREIKKNSLSKIQGVLGSESIDPDIDPNVTVMGDRESLLFEALLLESIANRLSPKTLKKMSKPNFSKIEFYNREEFDKDWTVPSESKYVSTLEFLEQLALSYDGSGEETSNSEVFGFLKVILEGFDLLPDKERLLAVKQKIPLFYSEYFKKLDGEFSTESMKLVKSNLDNINLSLPKSKEEYLQDIIGWVQYKQSLAESVSKELDLKGNKKAQAYFGREYLQKLLNGESEEGAVSELPLLIGVSAMPDFYIGAYNGIKVGPFAIEKFESSGKQVLGHEMAHHVGHFMEDRPLSSKTTGKFEKIRECLASSHKEDCQVVSKKIKSLNKKIYKWKENFYTEEDFADWMSSKTSEGNFACHFARNTKTDLPEADLFKNPDPKDPHSSPFYRLLNIELHQKGKLPAVCQSKYIKKCP